jgi:crotonobetainyl-CoA:carnitine CoA-transferase CaiB-like acyl-CoA transferase
MADIAGGSYIGLSSILAALYSAEKSKKGAHVVVDMTAALAPLGLFPKLENSVEENYPGKRILSGIAPNYNIYECKDGKFIALAALEIKFWKLFCTFFKLNEFENITFQNQQENDRVIQFLQKFFFEKNRDEWVALTKKEDFCLSGIYAPDEVSNPYPLAQDSDSFLNPFRISGHEPNKLWKFKD